MAWAMLEDTMAPMMRWQTRLTAETPDGGYQSLALVKDVTVQAEGVFGSGSVQISGSNSGSWYVPLDELIHNEIRTVLPVYTIHASLINPDDTSDVLVTLAGRR